MCEERQPEVVIGILPASRTTSIRIIPGVRGSTMAILLNTGYIYLFPPSPYAYLTCLFYLSGTSVTLLAVMGSRNK
ncbi:unnamed protein product [Musa banksii]